MGGGGSPAPAPTATPQVSYKKELPQNSSSNSGQRALGAKWLQMRRQTAEGSGSTLGSQTTLG